MQRPLGGPEWGSDGLAGSGRAGLGSTYCKPVLPGPAWALAGHRVTGPSHYTYTYIYNVYNYILVSAWASLVTAWSPGHWPKPGQVHAPAAASATFHTAAPAWAGLTGLQLNGPGQAACVALESICLRLLAYKLEDTTIGALTRLNS